MLSRDVNKMNVSQPETDEKNTALRTQKRDRFIEIQYKVQCTKFAKKWKKSTSEASDKQPYWDALFKAFGRNRESVATFELPAKTRLNPSGKGDIDLLWPGVLLVEHKSRGKDLDEALVQANGYLAELEGDDIPRYVILCDFFKFVLIDLKEDGKRYEFTINELPKKIYLLKFMWEDNATPVAQDIPVNVKASEIMGRIYDELRAAKYSEEDMEYLLTRLTFCLFAEDVGIFNKNQFLDYINASLKNGAQGLGSRLIELFDTLNKPKKDRMTTLDKDLKAFEYINGGLFERHIDVPSFTVRSSQLLKEAASYNWNGISPVIFGSLFQSVMNTAQRRSSGAHYTSEENIMKVLKPLFLDGLYEEFYDAIGNNVKLLAFHEKLSKTTFFDPACGAGNFLILAYREIRRLETELLYLLHGENKLLTLKGFSKIDVNQFYGIEINKFSQMISQTAMWMMDHLMNLELGDKLAVPYTRIPIEQSPHIIHGDALELDWDSVLSTERCSYILGNPPFGGSKTMTMFQRNQIKNIANISKTGGTLDYVCGWFIKATQYADESTCIGFVSTNSITQGAQVGQLWPIIQRHGWNIAFAYTTFKWDSEAKGKAHVHVVIIGLAKQNKIVKRRLYHDELETNPSYISPSLSEIDKDIPIVKNSTVPLNGLPRMVMGSKPIDGGNYIFTDEEKVEFLKTEPLAKSLIKQYMGAKEFINDVRRWILDLRNTEPHVLRSMPEVLKRVELVRMHRAKSSADTTQDLSPTRFHLNVTPTKPFLAIAGISSEKRKYIPIGYLDSSIIPSNRLYVIKNTSMGLFGLIISRMHMAWLDGIGGKLETRFSYSIGMVYNTFPVPAADLDTLEPYARKIIKARENHAESTLADLYDERAMPDDLKKAHEALDKAVDKLYRPEPFKSNKERLEFFA